MTSQKTSSSEPLTTTSPDHIITLDPVKVDDSFAKGLLKRGFDRATVQQALSVDKAETSRLLQIADAMPTRFVHAIGPE